MTIPILVGSLRPTGNNVGLAELLLECCKIHGVDADLASKLLPCGSSLPTGPVLDDLISAAVKESSQYSDSNVQAWSRLVSSSPAIIVLTPQYNWGVPGPLKNTLDHIFYEWKDKPILVMTYGGHGGDKCGNMLKLIFEGGLKATLITDPVNITLPMDLIKGSERVDPSNPNQTEFRTYFKETLNGPLESLKQKML